jgi:hypothetical protein
MNPLVVTKIYLSASRTADHVGSMADRKDNEISGLLPDRVVDEIRSNVAAQHSTVQSNGSMADGTSERVSSLQSARQTNLTGHLALERGNGSNK